MDEIQLTEEQAYEIFINCIRGRLQWDDFKKDLKNNGYMVSAVKEAETAFEMWYRVKSLRRTQEYDEKIILKLQEAINELKLKEKRNEM